MLDKIIISFANTKGGSFKSTTAMAIVDYLKEDYLIIDTDAQESIVDFNNDRDDDKKLNVVAATTAKEIEAAIKNTDAKYIIIDTPGHAEYEAIRNRIYELSTLIVLTVKTGGTDFNVLKKNLKKLVNSRFHGKFRVLFGAESHKCTVYRMYREAIDDTPIATFKHPFLKYKDTDKAWLSGLTLSEYHGSGLRNAQKAVLKSGPLQNLQDFTREIVKKATDTHEIHMQRKGK